MVLVAAILAPALTGAEERDAAQLKRVTFLFPTDHQFNQVFLAGTFNAWSTDATPMHRTDEGYEVSLPLPAGEYQYKFVADGQWITDENAEKFHPDGYGGQNSVIVVDDSFEAMAMARGDGDLNLDGLGHTDNAWERELNSDGTVTVRVKVWKNDLEEVRICRRRLDGEALEDVRRAILDDCMPMEPFDSDGTYDYYRVRLSSPNFAYCFRLIDGEASAVIDRTGAHLEPYPGLAPFEFYTEEVEPFRTPDWVKEAIIYQIFPERFANGDPGNDPDFTEWYYEGLTTLPPSGKTNGEYFHLVEDWYEVAGLKRSPYKTDGKPDWNSFYGGDLEGVRANLDYLVDLGITAIYFNPLFKAKSNHKYDAATYMEIDPHFASNEEFKAFVAECHSQGIRVIMDLALNHTGHTYWAFVDAREEGRESDYWNWYEWKKWPVPGDKVHAPVNASDYYDCWWGFGQMPNLNFDLARPGPDEPPVKDPDQARPNQPVVNRLLDVAEYWLAEYDVDGYRLDVAGEVPFWFWEMFRRRVRETKPEAYIVGELWGSSPEWINGRYFDAAMNYKFFRDPVLAFIAKGEMSAAEFDRSLAPGRLVYPREGVLAQMNLLDSHDTERFLTSAGRDVRRLKLAMLFAMTYVGAPTIYYGDEIAMEGGGDPDCRRPFFWKWEEDSGRVEVHEYVKRLTAFRKEHPCLVYGAFETLLAEDKAYVFRRRHEDDQVIVAMNAGLKRTPVEIPLGPGPREFVDPFSGLPATPAGSGASRTLTLTLKPLAGTVLVPAGE
jgi:glycosidase